MTLLWAFFCACSWTWCIGMYLPVILIEHFGWPGFIAFAVPNILGCGAFAFVLRAAGAQSKQLVAQHGRMMTTFSAITVAFHMFFTVWLLSPGGIISTLDLPWWGPMLVALVIYALAMVFAFLNDRDWLALAVVVYAISLAAMIALGFSALDRVPSGHLPFDRLLWLVPTLCFGFGLCPYLDLTFHRAAQRSPRPRVTFAMFSVAFAVMLLLTVLLWFGTQLWAARAITLLAIGHIFAQMIFTCGAHLRELRLTPVFQSNANRALAMLAPIIGIAAMPIALWLVGHLPASWLRGLSPDALAPGPDVAIVGEWTYLAFLFGYGMVFPSYVLLALATRRPFSSSRDWLGFIVVIIASTPCYAAGFIGNRTPWLLPPLALAIICFLLRRRAAIT